MIIQRHYENLNIMYENTMPYRSYYIPLATWDRWWRTEKNQIG